MPKKKSVQVDNAWTDNSGLKKQEVLKPNKQIAKSYMIKKWLEDKDRLGNISFKEYVKQHRDNKDMLKAQRARDNEKAKEAKSKKTIAENPNQSTIFGGYVGSTDDVKKKANDRKMKVPIRYLCFHYRGACEFQSNDPGPCTTMCANFVSWENKELGRRTGKKGLKVPVTWFDIVNLGTFKWKERKRVGGELITIIHETTNQVMSSIDQYEGVERYDKPRTKKNVAEVSQFNL